MITRVYVPRLFWRDRRIGGGVGHDPVVELTAFWRAAAAPSFVASDGQIVIASRYSSRGEYFLGNFWLPLGRKSLSIIVWWRMRRRTLGDALIDGGQFPKLLLY